MTRTRHIDASGPPSRIKATGMRLANLARST